MEGGTSTEELLDGAIATKEDAKSIKAIDKTTVHRICSGQVVLTLATAVKELVENSLDAAATSVEVRLREHGITLLEVSDNGKGVEECNFEGLTLKHHTSKLRDFGDLVGVKTFGFRGEALSSLCALSDLTITTRHASQEVGTKLVYDHNGKIITKTPVSRQVGTTVSLEGLFSTLPVRHKEFHRNIKKEFSKMVQVLYSYCLISTGVRIMCTNHTDKGKKTVVLSTSGHPTVKENVSAIFGSKQVSNLLEFKQKIASTDVLEEFGMESVSEVTQGSSLFTLEGYISSCAHGQGRSAADRQFYYINSRPCDPARVMKLVNEVYHHYNRHQSPCVVLNIHLKEDDVDINVTPDKRQILVNNEKLLLATIKTSLIHLFENIPSTYNIQNVSTNSPLNNSFSCSFDSPNSRKNSPTTEVNTGKLSALSQLFGRRSGGSPLPESSPGTQSGTKRSLSYGSGSLSSHINKQPKLTSFLKKNKSEPPQISSSVTEGIHSLPSQSVTNGMTEEIPREAEDIDKPNVSGHENCVDSLDMDLSDKVPTECGQTMDCSENLKNTQDIDSFFDSGMFDERNFPSDADNDNGKISCGEVKTTETEDSFHIQGTVTDSENNGLKSGLAKFSRSSSSPASSNCTNAHSATDKFLSNLIAKKSQITQKMNFDIKNSSNGDEKVSLQNAEDKDLKIIFEASGKMHTKDIESVKGINSKGDVSLRKVMCEDYDDANGFINNRKSKEVNFSLEVLRERVMSSQATKDMHRGITRKFHAKISPTDNNTAEDELRKEISKDMFTKMEILGQFNLGFIITCLGSDLFIIDQHATDEKYNFETLQQTCILQNQRLIIPQTLELTAVNESILLDNIEIFKKNGFEFKVDEDKPVGRRVSLVSMPFSRGWEFGREDIEELIFMLSDAPGVMCRPSRVRAMFASRACRKSIMIGTALDQAQMEKLVFHMGEIEQPWNCPHGRPTMRHLVNLDMIAAPT